MPQKDCLGNYSIAYTNRNLSTSVFGGATAIVFLNVLIIYNGTSQRVYYKVAGTSPNRTITFEFYDSKYFEMSDGGESAIIGTQGKFYFQINVS